MRNSTSIGDRLRATALILRTRNATLWPDLHSNADDLIALLTEKETSDAGIDSAAHPKKDSPFCCCHRRENGRLFAALVNPTWNLSDLSRSPGISGSG